jgi:hypothetical protein
VKLRHKLQLMLLLQLKQSLPLTVLLSRYNSEVFIAYLSLKGLDFIFILT